MIDSTTLYSYLLDVQGSVPSSSSSTEYRAALDNPRSPLENTTKHMLSALRT